MRWLQYIVLAVGLIGLGCNTTGKKPAAQNTKQSRDDSPQFWEDPKNPKSAPNIPPTPVDGMLAGKLIDSYGKAMPNAVVNVSAAGSGPNVKPIGIQSDDQGYFTLYGLKAGTTYVLSVRAEDNGKVLGGHAQTQAPNTRMLIPLSEDRVSPSTPAAMPNPAATIPFPDKKDGKTKLGEPPTTNVPAPDSVPKAKDPLMEGADQSWAPGKSPPTVRPVAPPPPPTSSANPNIADSMARNQPPTVNIAGPSSAPAPIVEPPPSAAASPTMSAVPSNSSPVPSAPVMPPQRSANFTVFDLAEEPIEFKNFTDRRLIVLEFWSTKCTPCLQKIPALIDLQARYSEYIAVIGIACDDAPWAERKASVEDVQKYYRSKAHKPINYQIYLEGNKQEGRIQQMFNVRAYPTMVLLDHTGRELKRANDIRVIEDAIRYHLQPR